MIDFMSEWLRTTIPHCWLSLCWRSSISDMECQPSSSGSRPEQHNLQWLVIRCCHTKCL